ncbi:unnamed protein product [Enterobius vermicularis]|uniref:MPN domain-containing protein n=1 Tax=Enterobius vermicularis TaxID=51028 RepID=A0A0N4V9U1_ENTVE|nr:unnamed protein product [Enterobius vermicularis]
MDEDLTLHLDPVKRMKTLMDSTAIELNPSIPLNRYYRSLNEIYRVAGFYVEEKNFEKALSLYIRFVTLAVEELPNHQDYKGFTSQEKIKAEKSLAAAFDRAELLKQRLKEKFEADSIRAKQILEEREAERAERAAAAAAAAAAATAVVDNNDLDKPSSVSQGLGDSLKPSAPSSQPCYDSQNGLLRRPCTLRIASGIVGKFIEKVERNTSLNIETCAVLCGNMGSGGIYRITHAVIPKQDGSPDSCDMHNEEEIFAFQDNHNLITLGWIHTHPSQTAFLSSVDLHTHCAYQLMLPEAIAIVVAPKYNQVVAFRLSPEGMKEVGNCHQTKFHPHDNSNSLFNVCTDVEFDSKLNAEVIDLR